MRDDIIALFTFEKTEGEVAISLERHYKLVEASDLTDEDLAAYRRRT